MQSDKRQIKNWKWIYEKYFSILHTAIPYLLYRLSKCGKYGDEGWKLSRFEFRYFIHTTTHIWKGKILIIGYIMWIWCWHACAIFQPNANKNKKKEKCFKQQPWKRNIFSNNISDKIRTHDGYLFIVLENTKKEILFRNGEFIGKMWFFFFWN